MALQRCEPLLVRVRTAAQELTALLVERRELRGRPLQLSCELGAAGARALRIRRSAAARLDETHDQDGDERDHRYCDPDPSHSGHRVPNAAYPTKRVVT